MFNSTVGMTVVAPAITSITIVGPEYIRLPSPGTKDPCFGLTRSYLNLLILPLKENGFRPPVRSSVLRRPGAKTGVRLVNVASLRAYLHDQLQIAEAKSTGGPYAAGSPELVATISNVEFMRFPKPKGRDPMFGLSRSFLNQLILPCEKNGYRPPLQSHVLRRRGYRRGIRLIGVDSLRNYIKAHEEPSSSSRESPAPSGS
jgi:hypothetical protein